MKLSQVKQDVIDHLTVGNNVFLWGPAGVGKTDILHEIAAEQYDGNLIDIRASQLDPVDLRGVPSVEAGHTKWNVPDFLPRVDRDGERGMIIWEEANAAPMLVQVALYQIMLPPYRLGDYQLPEGWRQCATGNRQKDKAGAQRMSSALANRFVHIDVDVDATDWLAWAAKNNMPAELQAFIAWRREPLLHNMDETDDFRTFASPRSVAMAGKVLHLRRRSLIESCCGASFTSELWGFLQIYQQLPKPIDITSDPHTAKLPTEPSARYAVAMLCARIMTKTTSQVICTYLARLPAEFSVLAMTQAIARDPDLKKTKAFVAWAVANQHVTL